MTIDRIRQLLRRMSLFPKMLFLTVFVGVILTVIINRVEETRVGSIFRAELVQNLSRRADVDRMRFDAHVARYHEAIKLVVAQKRFVDYVSSPRFSSKNGAVNNLSELPAWLPDASIMRHLVRIQFALLIDGSGRVREVFQATHEQLPPSLLHPAELLIRLSHSQSYMTSIEGKPFLLAAESVSQSEGERKATLLFAQELNSEFIEDAHEDNGHDDIVALIGSNPQRIIASSMPSLIPTGATVESLKGSYLMIGKSFFDWGASDLVLEYATFVSAVQSERLNEAIIHGERRERNVMSAVLILAFSLLVLWMTGRIRRLTEQMADLAKKKLDMTFPEASGGDQFARLQEQFHAFVDEIGRTRELLKRQAEELLKEKTVYLDNVLQSSSLAIVATDLESRVKYFNQAAGRLFGPAPGAVIGMRIDEMKEGLLSDVFKRSAESVARGDEYADVREWPSVAGSIFVEVSVRQIRGTSYERAGTLLIAHDITARINAEKNLQLFRGLVDQSDDFFFVVDPETAAILDLNEKACATLGYSRDELLAMRVLDIRGGVITVAAWRDRVQLVKKNGSMLFEISLRRKDGYVFPVELSVRFVSRENNSYLISVARDITDRKRIEMEMRIRDNAIANSISGIVLSDMEGTITYANRAYLSMLGYDSADEVLGRPLTDFAESPERVCEIKEALRQQNSWVGENTGRKKDGTSVARLMYASVINDETGAPIRIFSTVLDITERKQTEAKLREHDRRQKAILNNIPDMAWLKDRESRFLAVNEPFGRACGVSPEEVMGKTDFEIWPTELAERYRADDRSVIESRARKQVEEPLIDARGLKSWIETVKTPMFDEGGAVIGTIGIARDMTERKLAENKLRESEERLRRAQAVGHIGSWEFDIAKDKLVWSEEIYRMFEIEPGCFGASYDAFMATVHPDDRQMVNRAYTESLRDRTPYSIVHRLLMIDGRIKFVQEFGESEYDASGKPVRSIGTVQDVTERKLDQERIEASLREKETLLREIHHRVKNNLQIISSLLYFQAKKVRDPEGHAALQEAQDRLKSMILVHEKLYRSKDLTRIEMAEFVRTLIDQTVLSHGPFRKKVTVALEIDTVSVSIEIALPCGMILNELLTNVYKYAFPGDRSGTACVRLTAHEGQMEIVVSDDGIGIGPEFELERPSGFGLQLVTQMVKQVRGRIELGRTEGTSFRITVPIATSEPAEPQSAEREQ